MASSLADQNDPLSPVAAASAPTTGSPAAAAPGLRLGWRQLRRPLSGFVFLLALVAGWALVAAPFSRSVAPPDPEAMADAWSRTVAQFGISPIFPPQEDVRVGDLYAVLGDAGSSRRITLKAHRAVRLTHLDAADELLRSGRKVLVLPSTPETYATSRTAVRQVECTNDPDCYDFRPASRQMPVVVLPGVSVANLRDVDVQGGWLAGWIRSAFSTHRLDTQSVAIEVPYAETYGLNMIDGARLLNDYCDGHESVCTDMRLRKMMAMIAGDQVWETDSDLRYARPIHLVLVNSVYVVRSITYSFASDTSAGIRAQVYARVEKRLQADAAQTPASRADAPASLDVPTASLLLAQQKERERLLQVVAEETGRPGSGLGITFGNADRVTIDQVLPHPVAIGFVPVRLDLVRGTNLAARPPAPPVESEP